jgi:hypothetical protein
MGFRSEGMESQDGPGDLGINWSMAVGARCKYLLLRLPYSGIAIKPIMGQAIERWGQNANV